MKKSILLWQVVFLYGSAFVAISVLNAATARYKSPPPTHQQTIISSVTANSVTVATQTLSDKGKVLNEKSRTFVITKFTEINVNGQKATATDLKPKMKVTVTVGMDPSQAARVVANG
jgi:hypothetical protein